MQLSICLTGKDRNRHYVDEEFESSKGRATQKRNITPGTHKASAGYGETCRWMDLMERVIGIPGRKKVGRRVLDDPSTGHAPDRSRYFIRSRAIFSKQATDDKRWEMDHREVASRVSERPFVVDARHDQGMFRMQKYCNI